jgi:hypothetical protein
MTWYPIAFLPPQIEDASGLPYSGAVLKAHRAGTTTPIPMATDYTGVSTAATLTLNASGYPVYNGTVVIPHLQENYKLSLYPNQAAADANSGAVWSIDNVQISQLTNTPFVQYFDGTGSQTVFNLSQNFGTDSKILMVFADNAVTKRAILRPDEYTLVGNVLTIPVAPTAGTKNIIVFSPSQLLGAANNAAAAAATSEANALGYANSASASAVAAAASYDSFDDRYLGAKAADPTLDNDGNALLNGALYWNTPSAVLKVYNLSSTTWQVAFTPSAGTLVAANNLSDVPNKPTARTNLGVAQSGANTDITSLASVSSINGGQLAGMRNRIINGDFRIAQRGSTGNFAGGSGIYTLDRWQVFYTGTAPTSWSQGGGAAQFDTLENQSNNLSVVGAAGNTAVTFGQKIEANNCRDLAGQQVTLSYWIFQDTGATVNVQGSLSYANAIDNFSGITAIASLTAVPVPTATWTLVSGTLTLPAAATTGLFIQFFSQGTAILAGKAVAIANAQLELGATRTRFERRPLGLELTLCQRYAVDVSYMIGQQFATTGATFTAWFPVKMRAAPSGVNSTLTIASVFIVGAGTATGLASLVANSTSTNHCRVSLNFTAIGSGSAPAEAVCTAGSYLSAEL